jgi:hypothetical protein
MVEDFPYLEEYVGYKLGDTVLTEVKRETATEEEETLRTKLRAFFNEDIYLYKLPNQIYAVFYTKYSFQPNKIKEFNLLGDKQIEASDISTCDDDHRYLIVMLRFGQ